MNHRCEAYEITQGGSEHRCGVYEIKQGGSEHKSKSRREGWLIFLGIGNMVEKKSMVYEFEGFYIFFNFVF